MQQQQPGSPNTPTPHPRHPLPAPAHEAMAGGTAQGQPAHTRSSSRGRSVHAAAYTAAGAGVPHIMPHQLRCSGAQWRVTQRTAQQQPQQSLAAKGTWRWCQRQAATRSRHLRFCSTVWTVVACACSSMLRSGAGRNTLQVLARTPRSGCSRAFHACRTVLHTKPGGALVSHVPYWLVPHPQGPPCSVQGGRPRIQARCLAQQCRLMLKGAHITARVCRMMPRRFPWRLAQTHPTPSLGTWPNSPQLNVQAAAGTHQSLPSL